MAICIGGERAWKLRQAGDIGISYQWVNGEPAMILYPLHRRVPNAGAFAICLSAAHQYAHSDGHPNLDYVIPQVVDGALVMGFQPEKSTIKRIIDVILDGLPDLVEMPNEPNWAKENQKQQVMAGELIIKRGGETILQEDVPAITAEDLDRLEIGGHA